MRSLILLGTLTLLAAVALADIDNNVEDTSAIHVRAAREALPGKNKESKRQKRRKITKRKNNKNRRRFNKSKKNKQGKRNKGAKKRNKSQSGRVPCEMSDVKTVYNAYVTAYARQTQIKRLKTNYKQVTKKGEKCSTSFTDGARVFGLATANGTECGGSPANQTIQVHILYNLLLYSKMGIIVWVPLLIHISRIHTQN